MERPVLPWVRLHAVRGYLDMLTAARVSGARMTFNFTPSLIKQLHFAEQTNPPDEFAAVSLIPSRDLTEEQKRFILTHFFSINWAVHVKQNSRYNSLLTKRGDRVTESTLKTALTEFALQDYTDLVALFNLSWIGFTKRKDTEVRALIQKGRAYTQSDIEQILAIHQAALSEVIPGYKQLQKSGQIEISTSPYSHPILPLLCDTKAAAPDIPRQLLPSVPYQHPEDAERHLRVAAKVYREAWDEPPRGLWPSEGSVSNDALELAAQTGYKWLASDEAILARSEGGKSQLKQFTSYDWSRGQGSIRCYFRDHALSDAIGFRYSTMSATDATTEFIGHLETIERNTRGKAGRCVVIALDGENPWESYVDGGEGLLSELLSRIDSHQRLETMTFSEHMEFGTRERIKSIHAGSWIDSNFKIWIGDPEKNQAWTELGRARQVVEGLIAGDARIEAAWNWLLEAQSSDWFWWYGEPFHSAYDGHFDELFRAFLKAVYAAVGRQHPVSLNRPIAGVHHVERRLQPAFSINPVIDGKETSFFEWKGACRIDPRQYGVMMGRSEELVNALYYGFNASELFFRLDLNKVHHHLTPHALELHFQSERELSFSVPLDSIKSSNDEGGLRWAVGEVVELAVSLGVLTAAAGEECQFYVEIHDADSVLERLPPTGEYRFRLPTTEELAANWIV